MSQLTNYGQSLKLKKSYYVTASQTHFRKTVACQLQAIGLQASACVMASVAYIHMHTIKVHGVFG